MRHFSRIRTIRPSSKPKANVETPQGNTSLFGKLFSPATRAVATPPAAAAPPAASQPTNIMRTMVMAVFGMSFLLKAMQDGGEKKPFVVKMSRLDDTFKGYAKELKKATRSGTSPKFMEMISELILQKEITTFRSTARSMVSREEWFDLCDQVAKARAEHEAQNDNISSNSLLNLDEEQEAAMAQPLSECAKKVEDAEKQYVDFVCELIDPELTGLEAKIQRGGVEEAHKLLSEAMRPRCFVIKFKGDMQASQVETLKEEVTFVVRGAEIEQGDHVVVNVESGGGTVTGYGLASAQLQRLRDAGLHVTVCVDQVAASGGYMMACVGQRLVASPFAMLGSIGVVSLQPNFAERLAREGVRVEDVAAGKYKRTMVPYKTPTSSDRAKVKKDVEGIHSHFKQLVKTNRPSLNIDQVATGEVWMGTDALNHGLCDELATSDEVLLRYATLPGPSITPSPAVKDAAVAAAAASASAAPEKKSAPAATQKKSAAPAAAAAAKSSVVVAAASQAPLAVQPSEIYEVKCTRRRPEPGLLGLLEEEGRAALSQWALELLLGGGGGGGGRPPASSSSDWLSQVTKGDSNGGGSGTGVEAATGGVPLPQYYVVDNSYKELV